MAAIKVALAYDLIFVVHPPCFEIRHRLLGAAL
jgi:hypothetical protein